MDWNSIYASASATPAPVATAPPAVSPPTDSPPAVSPPSGGGVDWGSIYGGQHRAPAPAPTESHVDENVKDMMGTGGGDPLSGIRPMLHGAARAAGSTVGKVVDILSRPDEANLAAKRYLDKHHPASNNPLDVMRTGFGSQAEGLRTLIHGESPEQYQDDVEAVTQQLMGATPEEYRNMPGWRRKANEFATQLITDPTTYLGGAGIMDAMSELGVHASLPMLGRMVEGLQNSKFAGARAAGNAIQEGFDFTHYKGDTLRTMAARRGAEGVDQFRGLKAINAGRRTKALDLQKQLKHEFNSIIGDLTTVEQDSLWHAIDEGTTSSLPEHLRVAATRFQHLTDSLAHLGGTPELRQMLAQQRTFQLPDNMRRFELENGATRDIQGSDQFRKNYVPTAHDVRQFVNSELGHAGITSTDEGALTAGESRLEDILNNPADIPKAKTSGLSSNDAFLKERGEEARILGPDAQRKVIERRLTAGAQSIAARDAERSAAELFGVKDFSQIPPEAKEFFRDTVQREGGKDFWKGLIDVPKVAMFALPFRHMVNIGSLSWLADPSMRQQYGQAAKFFQIMAKGADPETRAKILGKAYKYGVAGVPSHDRAAGWIGKIPKLGEIYKASNHALWTFDDAVKATRFNNLLKDYMKRGMEESQAAYRAASDVSAELIDYSDQSPLTKFLSYVAPFSTYRTKAPVAIGRAVIRHPERVLASDRLAPELTGGTQQAGTDPETHKPQVGKAYIPLAETLRAVDNPMEYTRSTMGWPLQMAAGGIEKAIGAAQGKQVEPYFTYGKAPDAKYALNATVGSFPWGDFALDAMPHIPGLKPRLRELMRTNSAANYVGQHVLGPEFSNQGDVNNFFRSQTGFGLTTGASHSEIEAQQHINGLSRQIDQAMRNGNIDQAQQLQKRLDTYRRFHRVYVP